MSSHTVERLIDGSYLIYGLDDTGHLFWRRYFGYKKSVAISMFREEIKKCHA